MESVFTPRGLSFTSEVPKPNGFRRSELELRGPRNFRPGPRSSQGVRSAPRGAFCAVVAR
eukprot:12429756-Alexandrium_andersonii.AAC.1